MATQLGTLTLNLIAKVGQYTSGLQEAENQTNSSTSKMSEALNTYGAVLGGAVAGAVIGLATMASEFAEQANQLELLAYRAQTTTQEFQKMAIGAKQMGIEAEQLADIYKDFNEKLGEFLTVGGGGATDFYEQVALKTEGSTEAAKKLMVQMADLSGPEGMELYVAKMEEANLSQSQMSFLMESMGGDATLLLPLLTDGAEGFRVWGDMAERAGIIMDDETIAASRRLGIETQLLNMQYEGLKNQLMQAVMPTLVDIASAFFSAEGESLKLDVATVSLSGSLRLLAKMGLGVASTFRIVQNILGGTAAAMASAEVSAEDVIRGIESEILSTAQKMNRADGEGGMSNETKDRLTEIANQKRALENMPSKNHQAETAAFRELGAAQAESAKNTADNSKEQENLIKQLKEQANAIDYSYMPALDKMQKDHLKALAEINAAVFTDEHKTKLLNREKSLYDMRVQLHDREFAYDITQHLLTEEQKLFAEKELDKSRVAASVEYTKDERKRKLKAIDEVYELELKKLKELNVERIAAIHEEFSERAAYSQGRHTDSLAQIALSPQEYQVWSLQNEMSSELSGANRDFDADVSRINEKDDSGRFLHDEQERFALLLGAEEAYQQAKWAIQQEYALLNKELQDEQHRAGLDALVAQGEGMASVWGGILGEQSTAYKAMAAMSSAYATYQALINVPKTYSDTFAAISAIPIIGPYIAMPMAAAAAATQVAQATKIKGTKLTGMAHDGIDNVPREGTWLLDKGERVVDSRTNSDLKDYLKNGNQPKIIINTLPGQTAETSTAPDGTVTIDIVDKKIKQAFNNLRDRNSHESKALRAGYAVSPV